MLSWYVFRRSPGCNVAYDLGYPCSTLDLPIPLHLPHDMGSPLFDLSHLCGRLHPHLPPSSIHPIHAKPRVWLREGMGGDHVCHIPDPLVMG
jgi:hypothetical protein